MNPAKLTRQTILYATSFILALCLRLILLGQASLTNAEATLALHAMGMPAISAGGFLANPGYVALTRVIFFGFGGSAFQARLVSAIFGSLLVFTPIFYMRWLEDKPAILLAFLLAVEPGLLAVSRGADGITMVIATLLFAVGALIDHKPILAGICLGMAILGGSTLLPFAIGIVLAAIWSGYYLQTRWKEISSYFNSKILSSLGIATGITLALVGTLAFIQSQPLLGIAGNLGSLLNLTEIPLKTTTALFLILSAWLIYSPFILFLGLAGIIRGIRSHTNLDLFLSRWLLISLVIVLVNPGRRVQDLAWAVIPLVALSARQIIAMFKIPDDNRPVFIGKAFFDFVILGFICLNLVGVVRSFSLGSTDISLRLIAVAGALLMIILVTILAGWGWSWRASLSGLICSLLFLMGIYELGMTRRAAGFGTNPEAEIWLSSPYVQNNGELLNIIHQFSTPRLAISQIFEVKVLNLDLLSLHWEMRSLPELEFTNTLDPHSSPAFVITSVDNNLQLGADYRGEVLNWQLTTNWDSMRWTDWAKWIVFQSAPTTRQNLVLWIRADVFPTK